MCVTPAKERYSVERAHARSPTHRPGRTSSIGGMCDEIEREGGRCGQRLSKFQLSHPTKNASEKFNFLMRGSSVRTNESTRYEYE